MRAAISGPEPLPIGTMRFTVRCGHGRSARAPLAAMTPMPKPAARTPAGNVIVRMTLPLACMGGDWHSRTIAADRTLQENGSDCLKYWPTLLREKALFWDRGISF